MARIPPRLAARPWAAVFALCAASGLLALGPAHAADPEDADRHWAPFARAADAYRTPPGWRAVDPFHLDVPVGHAFSLIGVDADEGAATRRALLQDPASRSQILLVRGPLVEWMPRVVERIRPLDGDPAIHFTEHALRTADGVHVDYLRIERPASDSAPARRHLLGIVDLGSETLVIDAGGPARSFDLATVEGFLRSLRLRRRPDAPAAPPEVVPAAPEGER